MRKKKSRAEKKMQDQSETKQISTIVVFPTADNFSHSPPNVFPVCRFSGERSNSSGVFMLCSVFFCSIYSSRVPDVNDYRNGPVRAVQLSSACSGAVTVPAFGHHATIDPSRIYFSPSSLCGLKRYWDLHSVRSRSLSHRSCALKRASALSRCPAPKPVLSLSLSLSLPPFSPPFSLPFQPRILPHFCTNISVPTEPTSQFSPERQDTPLTPPLSSYPFRVLSASNETYMSGPPPSVQAPIDYGGDANNGTPADDSSGGGPSNNVCDAKCLAIGVVIAVVLAVSILIALIYPFYIRPKRRFVSFTYIYVPCFRLSEIRRLPLPCPISGMRSASC
jgi:hypothetical protein